MKEHWDKAYRDRKPSGASWYQAVPALSLRLIEATGISKTAPLLDVGGGDSRLADHLLARDFTDLTVVDIAPLAIQSAQKRLGAEAHRVHWILADVTTWTPPRRYGLWHDRAVFHFLVAARAQQAYARTLRRALTPGGHVVIATFGPSGPTRCSGLPVLRHSPESLAAALGEGLTLIESVEELHETPAGSVQEFIYCRFQAEELP